MESNGAIDHIGIGQTESMQCWYLLSGRFFSPDQAIDLPLKVDAILPSLPYRSCTL